MLGDARVANEMAEKLLQKGIYVIGFNYPEVPKGEARIRFQVSPGHGRKDINYLVEMIKEVNDELPKAYIFGSGLGNFC
ncbi:MAG: aminotransferase class I/II-fold pyridoxal phosphate-dependent enzyme [Nitrospinae bacterium]|nr:aminotransferase class I/II-fold pyridoxal phosphate-dependent enzyme [Nitrospinota bacterium]